jgi:hypothetical protein
MRVALFAKNAADLRQRTSELRTRAEKIADAEGRRTVLNLAKGYDLLAGRADITTNDTGEK